MFIYYIFISLYCICKLGITVKRLKVLQLYLSGIFHNRLLSRDHQYWQCLVIYTYIIRVWVELQLLNPASPGVWYSLGVCFLQKSTPEFIFGFRVHEDKLSIVRGQHVIHHHLLPFSILPESADIIIDTHCYLQYFKLFWNLSFPVHASSCLGTLVFTLHT